MKGISCMNERKFWDEATLSKNLRDEWLCDKNISDEQCLKAVGDLEGKILDLGCGIGRLTQGYGVDVSPRMLKLAKDGNEYKLGDGRTIPYPDGFFDSAFCVFMFQHIPDLAKHTYLEEVYRVLKKGVFRFQYVVGTQQTKFNYQTTDDYMKDATKDVGFNILKVDQGLIYPEWTWITAVK